MPKTTVYECDVTACINGSSTDANKFQTMSVSQLQGYDKIVYLCSDHQKLFQSFLDGNLVLVK